MYRNFVWEPIVDSGATISLTNKECFLEVYKIMVMVVHVADIIFIII